LHPYTSSNDASLAGNTTQSFALDDASTRNLADLCGQFNNHLRQIEQRLAVTINNRGARFAIKGQKHSTQIAETILRALFNDLKSGEELSPDLVHLSIQQYYQPIPDTAQPTTSTVAKESTLTTNDSITDTSQQDATTAADTAHLAAASNIESFTTIKTKKGNVKPRGMNQQRYVRSVVTHDINFGIGPAGTGKTYLAVACAVEALLKDEIERILLVRPAVEAGEKLGFLPGDLSQKVDPYLRPLYDALYEMLGFETVDKLIERNVIEIAPLAYMRGRTLNNAFVILDESQNTTREQMKMFLTRIGFGTTAVINGDPTQIDLPRGQASGLQHSVNVLDGVDGISFTHFTSKDVVRHPIVQRIVDAYERFDADHNEAPRQ